MILTKSEFRNEFGFKNLSSVSNLLTAGSIEENADGLIDLNTKKNKKWVVARKRQLERERQKEEEKQARKEQEKQEKAERENKENALEFDILNQRLNERLKKNQLLDIKIAEANKEVVGVDVLNKVITTVFDSLFKELAELPAVMADEIVNTVFAEKSPAEKVTTLLTDRILKALQTAVDTAEKKSKKYYE